MNNKENEIVTLINVYTVNPVNQDKLAKELIDAAETIMKSQRGYIGSRILKSRDGKSITVFAHWEKVENAAEIFKNSANRGYLERIGKLGSPNANFYDSVYIYNI